MSETEPTLTPKITTYPKFEYEDGDFTIKITLRGASPPVRTDYRVHAARLSAASIVFADMLEMGLRAKKSTSEAVPESIDIDSSHPPVWETVLGTLYGQHDFFETLGTCSQERMTTLKGCWNVAYKYQFKVVQLYCDFLLRYVPPAGRSTVADVVVYRDVIVKTAPQQSGLTLVLVLYERATVIQSTIVQDAALEWLQKNVGIRNLRMEVLDKVGTEAQNRLVRQFMPAAQG